MSKVHLVTFGCNHNFKKSRQRLVKQAEETGWFDNIFEYTPESLAHYNKTFSGRGAGYWWWKSAIQQDVINQIEENDILVYIDAGFYINKFAKKEFDNYLEIVNKNSGFLASHTSSVAKQWTKRDLFKLLDCDNPENTESEQIEAGLVFYRKNHLSVKFLKEFHQMSMIEHAINDDPSFNENYEGFVEHRHDQSIFSLLVNKIYKNENIDLIYYQPYYDKDITFLRNCIVTNDFSGVENLTYPFYTTRINDSLLINQG